MTAEPLTAKEAIKLLQTLPPDMVVASPPLREFFERLEKLTPQELARFMHYKLLLQETLNEGLECFIEDAMRQRQTR